MTRRRPEAERQERPADSAAGHREAAAGGSVGESLAQAMAHHRAGRLPEAERLYRRVLELQPDSADALHMLGVVAHEAKRHDRAVALIGKAIELNGVIPGYHASLGAACQALGQPDRAVAAYRRAIELKPDFSEAHNNLGNVLQAQFRMAEAAACYRRALAIDPRHAATHYNLGNALKALGRLDEAVAAYRSALAIRPRYVKCHANLGTVLKSQGRIEAAIACYRAALAIDPGFALAHRNLLTALLYCPGIAPEALFDEHRRFAEAHALPATGPVGFPERTPDPERRLRLGYLSSDLADHPVGWHLAPLITLRDRGAFEVFCYANVRRPDHQTERFKSLADGWRDTRGRSDAVVADMVRADGVDILVCLAARFDDNRPLVCAHRPAPVQVSLFDCATSGLEQMDYFMTDAVLNPEDGPERFTETLCRLPVLHQLAPLSEVPPATPPPAATAGFVTFGSFNNPGKMNPSVVALWAEILNAVPASRLLLKYHHLLGERSLGETWVERFAAHGVAPERLTLLSARDDRATHLGYYGQVDIALDPFPFTGSTATLEALWMGVPVVTLAGNTLASRSSTAILTHAGLGDLVATSPAEYLALARRLAADLAGLQDLRARLRGQVAGSPLCDGRAFTRSVEGAFRDMWRRWCRDVSDRRR